MIAFERREMQLPSLAQSREYAQSQLARLPQRLRGLGALVIVDVQNDFLPGGALAAPAGDQIVAPPNRVAAAFAEAGQSKLATRDAYCGFDGTELESV